MPLFYCNMTIAEETHPDLFTCNCGGFMFAGCGIKGGMTLEEELLTCTECDNEEVVLSENVEKAKENW
jgi:hypothetical protein